MSAIPVVLGVLFVASVWCLGYLTATDRISRAVFRPWRESIPVGDPHFWLRHRDYAAAWNGFVAHDVPYVPKRVREWIGFPGKTFDSVPEYLDVACCSALVEPEPSRPTPPT